MPLKQVLNIYAVYLIYGYSWYNIDIHLRCKFRTETNLVLVIFRKPKLKE